jgi:hypothetical protein
MEAHKHPLPRKIRVLFLAAKYASAPHRFRIYLLGMRVAIPGRSQTVALSVKYGQ